MLLEQRRHNWDWRLLLLLPSLVTGFHLFGNNGPRESSSTPPKVQICQHKDCCRQWTLPQSSLAETLQDLLPPDVMLDVETTGCLSECGKGPNLVLLLHNHNNNTSTSPDPILLHGVTGPLHLATELEQHLGIRIPSKLLAAVTVLQKARQGKT